ncbi:hypothetical protein cypCar_00013513 [Cyprinus carpio]|nr:hypothetical protein cypCar_00013513 [Cyprinus carpio]
MDMSKKLLLLYLTCSLGPMLSVQMCEVMWELEAEKRECLSKLENNTSGCTGEWDLACWPTARIGELVSIPCPNYFSHVSDQRENDSLMMRLSTFYFTKNRLGAEISPIKFEVLQA